MPRRTFVLNVVLNFKFVNRNLKIFFLLISIITQEIEKKTKESFTQIRILLEVS